MWSMGAAMLKAYAKSVSLLVLLLPDRRGCFDGRGASGSESTAQTVESICAIQLAMRSMTGGVALQCESHGQLHRRLAIIQPNTASCYGDWCCAGPPPLKAIEGH